MDKGIYYNDIIPRIVTDFSVDCENINDFGELVSNTYDTLHNFYGSIDKLEFIYSMIWAVADMYCGGSEPEWDVVKIFGFLLNT